MSIHLLPLFIPLLFILVFLEWKHDMEERKETGKASFNFQSSLTNISFGMIERVFDVFFFLALMGLFNYISANFGLFTFSKSSVLSWLACFVLLDFVIYWFHRSGHTINLLWGAHVTHHQCEEFNLTVAFRNSIFPHIFRSVYMLILPFLGFSGEMVIICLTISGIWQFGIHTKHIKKLGFLEWFMMTPSHHRVHHGRNPLYIDKNFGGSLIIWDRLFGTFQEEIEEVDFGITDKKSYNNPLEAMTHVWTDILFVAKGKKSFREQFAIWFQTPARFYSENEAKLATKKSAIQIKEANPRLKKYQLLHISVIAGLLLYFLVFVEFFTGLEKGLTIAFIVVSVINITMLSSNSELVKSIEKYRLLSMLMIPLIVKSGLLFIIAGVVVLCSIRRELARTDVYMASLRNQFA